MTSQELMNKPLKVSYLPQQNHHLHHHNNHHNQQKHSIPALSSSKGQSTTSSGGGGGGVTPQTRLLRGSSGNSLSGDITQLCVTPPQNRRRFFSPKIIRNTFGHLKSSTRIATGGIISGKKLIDVIFFSF